MENSTEELGVYILSAEFGLITHTRRIPFYDQRMTRQKAHEIKSKVTNQAQRLFADESSRQRSRRQLFINLGKDYFRAFEPAFDFLDSSSTITMTSGPTGKRLAEMHDWLYGSESLLRQPTNIEVVTGKATLRGVEIALTKNQVCALASKALRQGNSAAFSYQSWYVQIDRRRVSPKWLVSLLTDLPLSSFHSDEARRVLRQLGLTIHRV